MTWTFTCFPNLPTELRLKIFKTIVDVPRTVQIGWDLNLEEFDVSGARAGPAIMRVCKEARAEALKVYAQSQQNFAWGLGQALYINLEVDTLNFNTFSIWMFTLFASDLEKDQIRSLAITDHSLRTYPLDPFTLSSFHCMERYLSEFQHLNDLTLAINPLNIAARNPHGFCTFLRTKKELMVIMSAEVRNTDPGRKKPRIEVKVWTGRDRLGWQTADEFERIWAVADEV